MHLITARTERLYLQKISDNYHLFHAVVSTWTEPFPGWIDDFNGPAGLLVGGGKGLVRTAFADPNNNRLYPSWHMHTVHAFGCMVYGSWQV